MKIWEQKNNFSDEYSIRKVIKKNQFPLKEMKNL